MINKLKSIKYNKLYKPSHIKRYLFDNLEIIGRTQTSEQTLEKTFQWIKSSIDATNDDGSSAYYRYSSGWKGSYPETTGYLIPTMYDYAAFKNNDDLKIENDLNNIEDSLTMKVSY